MDGKKVVGENIKKVRLQRGLTQMDFAQRLGYTDSSTLSRIENGQTDIDTTKLKQIADALGVSPIDLFGPENFAHEYDDELLRAFHKAPLNTKEAIRLMLNLDPSIKFD